MCCRWEVADDVIYGRGVKTIEYYGAKKKQEKPTNCGTKAGDVLATFLPKNFNANLLNILVHMQLLRLHNAYNFKVLLNLLPFGRNLKGGF